MQSSASRLIDSLPDPVWTALPDGRADFVNKRWCEYTGLGFDEACGHGWHAAVHPDDRPDFLARWRSILESGGQGEVEARLRRFDGAYFWFLLRANPVVDALGKVVGWCGVGTDLGDRRWAETLLAGEKRLLEMVARSLPLAGVLEALCNFVEDAAPSCLCSILSIDPDGVRFRHGAGPSLPIAYNEVLDGLVMDHNYGPCGMAANLSIQVIAADVASDPRWKSSSWPGLVLGHDLRSCWSTPVLSRDDQVIGVFALYKREPSSPTPREQDLIRQFTHIASIAIERAQSDESLKQSEARKTAILNSALDCIITIDSEGRIVEFNPAAERTFGHLEQEVLGQPMAEVIIPRRLREKHQHGLARYLATGESRLLGTRVEMSAVRADGVEFPVELTIARTQSDGPPSFTGYLRDISERKRSEEALHKIRSELSHMARVTSLGALTASIAHEVNQPLAGIVTNANTCLKMLASDPPNVAGAQETARRTVRDGNRAADVIKRLRALFTKADTTSEAVDLNEAAREVVALSGSDLQHSRTVVRTELADDLPLVAGDRVQLQQVIMNLLLNAADAMSEIEDRPRRVVIRSERAGEDRVGLAVQDVGIGLDPQTADRLFEAFYTTKAEGMGIGLAVSRTIIENHGGRLWAAPNDGPGATFGFSIPRHIEEAPGSAIATL